MKNRLNQRRKRKGSIGGIASLFAVLMERHLKVPLILMGKELLRVSWNRL